MKRPFKIREAFVLHHEERFDDFMYGADFDFFTVSPKEYNEYRIRGNGSVGTGNINNVIYEPIAVYLELLKKGDDTVLVLKNKLRIDAVLITAGFLIIFLFFLYESIIDGAFIRIGFAFCIALLGTVFFNWIYYIQEVGLAKHLKMVLMNNDFIAINA